MHAGPWIVSRRRPARPLSGQAADLGRLADLAAWRGGRLCQVLDLAVSGAVTLLLDEVLRVASTTGGHRCQVPLRKSQGEFPPAPGTRTSASPSSLPSGTCGLSPGSTDSHRLRVPKAGRHLACAETSSRSSHDSRHPPDSAL